MLVLVCLDRAPSCWLSRSTPDWPLSPCQHLLICAVPLNISCTCVTLGTLNHEHTEHFAVSARQICAESITDMYGHQVYMVCMGCSEVTCHVEKVEI